ncbi:MAG: T9SS type A sorting domain-containing protein [Firmicutes bacterium]|nr:T9SS type A sorting domain-containing protein [Bacillota bacterium]
MKKITIVILYSLLFSFSSFAQFYQPVFGNEQTNWVVTNRVIIMEEPGWMDTISVIANENDYKVLELKSRWGGGNQLIGKIRSNETNSKLYFIAPSDPTELLVMDLDLEIGDAFSLRENETNRTIYVDNVYVLNGKKYIQFNDMIGLSTPPGSSKRIFIEGVGPNWGFESDCSPYLIACKYDDCVQTYSFENEHIKDCSFKNVNIDTYAWKNDITIYPNPAFGSAVIYISEMLNGNIHLYVYNTLGIELFNTTLSNSETAFDLSHLPSSIYFFKFQTPKKIITKKILKL